MRRVEEYWYKFEYDEDPVPYAKAWSFAYDLVDSMKYSLVLLAVLFTFALRPIGIEGDSMLPTLTDGSWVVASGFESRTQCGDIVIITQPNAMHKTLVKRVIAVGGQSVDIDERSGVVYVDGAALDEPYTLEPTYSNGNMVFPLEVPEGFVFVMGDNRNNSLDSRSSEVGFIDERYIFGKVSFGLNPFGRIDTE